jgi:cytochrome b561
MNTPRTRYSTLLVAIHWLTALLVLIAYLTSEGGRRVRLDPPQWHFFLGFAVLLLVVPRLLGRAAGGAPPPGTAGGAHAMLAAKVGHALLYLLLVAVPVTGWIAASKFGVPMTLGGITVPPIATAMEGKIGIIGDMHGWGGNAILILAGLHALAALWHHFFLKDATLKRMKPF